MPLLCLNPFLQSVVTSARYMLVNYWLTKRKNSTKYYAQLKNLPLVGADLSPHKFFQHLWQVNRHCGMIVKPRLRKGNGFGLTSVTSMARSKVDDWRFKRFQNYQMRIQHSIGRGNSASAGIKE